jgi:N utilization substance protein B
LGDTEFVYELSNGVVDRLKELDEQLRPLAPEWPLDTIAAVDRNILRIGLYELLSGNVPPKVAINESVELAKSFGSDNSSRFVNGVLGTAFRQLGLEEDKEGKHESSTNPTGQDATAPSAPEVASPETEQQQTQQQANQNQVEV